MQKPSRSLGMELKILLNICVNPCTAISLRQLSTTFSTFMKSKRIESSRLVWLHKEMGVRTHPKITVFLIFVLNLDKIL